MRADGAAVLGLAAKPATVAVMSGPNGTAFAVLHHAARVGGLDIGFVPARAVDTASMLDNTDAVLGADEIEMIKQYAGSWSASASAWRCRRPPRRT